MPDNLTIPATLAVEMGQEAFRALKDQIRETVESETGVRWEWRTEIGIDAMRLWRLRDA